MDSFNLKKDKNKKHIIIKRRKKKTDEDQMDNLTFYRQPILNLSNSNTNKKLENHKNITVLVLKWTFLVKKFKIIL